MTIKIDDNGDFRFDERFEFKCTDEEAVLIKDALEVAVGLAGIFPTIKPGGKHRLTRMVQQIEKAGM